MVSEKIIIILIIVAILLSIVSVVVTISTVNTNMIPKIHPKETVIPDSEKAQVGLTILTPPSPKE